MRNDEESHASARHQNSIGHQDRIGVLIDPTNLMPVSVISATASDTDATAHAAIAWYVRLKDGTASAEDHAEFQHWLEERPEHYQAYEDVQALWTRLGPAAAILGAEGWHRRGPLRTGASRIGRLYPALAAGIVALLVFAGAWWRDPGLSDRLFADYATAPGERRDITLSDGSRAYLDGDSAVDVSFSSADRSVRLLRGRVWFDVVHKDSAPFHVSAGPVEARDLGTAFAVERDTDVVTVTVERGRVTVTAPGMPALNLNPGQSVNLRARAPAHPSVVDPETALAWHRGLIVFDRASLGTVADEMGRMQRGRVLVVDEDLRKLVLSGVFRSDDPEAVLAALRSGLGVKTTTIPGLATLIHR